MLNSETSQRELTVCTLCDQQFTDPRVLPCLHTFCLQCLSKRHASFSETPSSCVACGGKYSGLPSELPSNGFTLKLIQMNRIADVASSQQTPCSVCQQDDDSPGASSDPSSTVMATHYCVNCAESLCGRSEPDPRLYCMQSGNLIWLGKSQGKLGKVRESQ